MVFRIPEVAAKLPWFRVAETSAMLPWCNKVGLQGKGGRVGLPLRRPSPGISVPRRSVCAAEPANHAVFVRRITCRFSISQN